MAALRWGICSAGKISHDFVVGLKSLPESEHQVVAVAAGRSLEPATKFAETHTIPRAYGSYQELANDKEVDIVYVGNVNSQHKQSVLMMIEAGKHVLCEKPMSTCSKDTAEMIAAARAKKVFFMEGWWTRFFPAVRELHKRVADGEIGEVKYIHVTFGYGFPKEMLLQRFTDPKAGEGVLRTMGMYPLIFATTLYGERPESVQTTGWKLSTGVDETAVITLKFPGERVAQVITSSTIALPNEALVVGTKGMFKVPALFYCPTKLETPNGVLEFPLPEPCLQTNYPNSVGLRYEASAVRECILAGKTECDLFPLDHSQIGADITESALEALGVEFK